MGLCKSVSSTSLQSNMHTLARAREQILQWTAQSLPKRPRKHEILVFKSTRKAQKNFFTILFFNEILKQNVCSLHQYIIHRGVKLFSYLNEFLEYTLHTCLLYTSRCV